MGGGFSYRPPAASNNNNVVSGSSIVVHNGNAGNNPGYSASYNNTGTGAYEENDFGGGDDSYSNRNYSGIYSI